MITYALLEMELILLIGLKLIFNLWEIREAKSLSKCGMLSKSTVDGHDFSIICTILLIYKKKFKKAMIV